MNLLRGSNRFEVVKHALPRAVGRKSEAVTGAENVASNKMRKEVGATTGECRFSGQQHHAPSDINVALPQSIAHTCTCADFRAGHETGPVCPD